ncbi:DUF6265 family protein [Massilia endophytica]|uniref:DUF6265 family protein n=1 Tax=Massilia endophytica TaxID=2899220 RepID=UPI001E560555|nr:DUF6265 family protein [Massilia endophytica]UGQ46290.1 DUF6265 family protein [Massilia endophytica]
MRTLLAALLASACMQAGAASVDQLGWLAGCWASEGGEPGSGEQWMAPAGGTMLGTARTVKGGKTVAWEFVQIRALDDGRLAYVAKPHNQAEAAFPLRSVTENEVVFEAPEHDFPQRIIYRREGSERLHARIEGTVKGKLKGIDFPLRRTACTQ